MDSRRRLFSPTPRRLLAPRSSLIRIRERKATRLCQIREILSSESGAFARAKGGKDGGKVYSIHLVLRVREREHLLFALVPGFVYAWFSSTRDRVVFLFVRVVVLVVLRGRRGLQSSSSVRHDVVSCSLVVSDDGVGQSRLL
jgi:hypothetical protein